MRYNTQSDIELQLRNLKAGKNKYRDCNYAGMAIEEFSTPEVAAVAADTIFAVQGKEKLSPAAGCASYFLSLQMQHTKRRVAVQQAAEAVATNT
jgi:hypothetical protein